MKFFLVLTIVLLIPLNYYLQSNDHYDVLQCKGNIPEDLSTSASEKASTGMEKTVLNTDDRGTQKVKSEFILKSNFVLDELLTGGSILFGDEITEYVNKVADKLLENEPELRKDLRFYCVRSNLTNAFATHQGMIFVTLGLISQIENESQLAYVLSHEISHYKRSHVINKVLEADKTLSNRNRTKNVSFDDNIIKLSNFSKTLELEADSVGYYIHNLAGYSSASIQGVFDVLQFSHLPFEEINYDFKKFENEFYTFPEEWLLEEAIPIDFEVNEDDSKSSHPNLNLRREQVKNISGDTEGKVYQVATEEEFLQYRKVVRFENLRINLRSANYVKTLYGTQILMESNPNSFYLKNAEFKSLYGIAMYKSAGEYYKLVHYFDNYEGEISKLYHLIEKMDAQTACYLALKSGWNLYQSDKNPLTLKRLESLLSYASSKEVIEVDKVMKQIKKNPVQSSENETKVNADNTESLTKYEKLQQLKKKELTADASNVNILQNVTDKPGFEKFLKNNIPEEKEDIVNDYSKKKVLHNIGAKKIVIVDPDYQKIDESKGLKLENSESSKYEFYTQIDKVSELSGLRVEVLAPKTLELNDINGYNDVSTINYWLSESFLHEDLVGEWNFIGSEKDYMTHFSEEYNTDFFAYTGVVNFKEKKKYVGGRIMMSVLVPYYLPFALIYAVTPKHYSYYYTLVYDIEKGDRVVTSLYEVDYKAHNTNVSSMMYDLFIQLKTKAK